MNTMSPDRMMRAERLDEVARLLTLAILRRRTRLKTASESAQDDLIPAASPAPDLSDTRR